MDGVDMESRPPPQHHPREMAGHKLPVRKSGVCVSWALLGAKAHITLRADRELGMTVPIVQMWKPKFKVPDGFHKLGNVTSTVRIRVKIWFRSRIGCEIQRYRCSFNITKGSKAFDPSDIQTRCLQRLRVSFWR